MASGTDSRPHVFVTVAEAGLTNGVTITTTRRTYYLSCKSVAKSPVRVVRWHYPLESAAGAVPVEAPGLLPHPDQPRQYHVGYEVKSLRGPVPVWTPRQVVDDGKKMFLLYPEVALFASVPLVRAIGVNGPQLLNARQHLNVVILDALFPTLELRVGVGEAADVVTITRGKGLRTITCPGRWRRLSALAGCGTVPGREDTMTTATYTHTPTAPPVVRLAHRAPPGCPRRRGCSPWSAAASGCSPPMARKSSPRPWRVSSNRPGSRKRWPMRPSPRRR